MTEVEQAPSTPWFSKYQFNILVLQCRTCEILNCYYTLILIYKCSLLASTAEFWLLIGKAEWKARRNNLKLGTHLSICIGINENVLKCARLADPYIFGYVCCMPNDVMSYPANRRVSQCSMFSPIHVSLIIRNVVLKLLNEWEEIISIFWIRRGINPSETKRSLLYLKTQFVPRFKHFSSRL